MHGEAAALKLFDDRVAEQGELLRPRRGRDPHEQDAALEKHRFGASRDARADGRLPVARRDGRATEGLRDAQLAVMRDHVAERF